MHVFVLGLFGRTVLEGALLGLLQSEVKRNISPILKFLRHLGHRNALKTAKWSDAVTSDLPPPTGGHPGLVQFDHLPHEHLHGGGHLVSGLQT